VTGRFYAFEARLGLFVGSGLLLMTVFPSSVVAQDPIADELGRIYSQYQAIQQNPDVATLVMLDKRLRDLLFRDDGYVDSKYLRPEYESMGLEPTLFEPDILSYSGRLLLQAHRLNPMSEHRRSTLYSTVFPGGNDHGNDAPSPRAAETYLRAFPDGPFAPHVTRTLAYFYDDLYKVIRFELAGERIDYKYSCYQRFLSNRPREQLTVAQQSAILYYRKAIALLPGDRYLPDRLREMEKGPDNGWHYCAD
jgi:hypothetical protein